MAKRDIFPTHPGILLKEEFLDPAGIRPGTLARALGVSRDRISELSKGERDITPDTALRLSAFFGTTADFWLNLQSHYDLVMAEAAFDKDVLMKIRHSAEALDIEATG